ncbi:MAG: DM13 domain-containing protein [Pseudomonadota bacterium]
MPHRPDPWSSPSSRIAPARRLSRRRAVTLLATGPGLLAACGTGGRSTPVAAPPPVIRDGARTTARGPFRGLSDHETSGHARVVFSAGEVIIELEDDFRFDGAPDPKVALGNQGFDPNTILGPLRANEGQQTYALKAGLDIGDYFEVWLWCERFDVPLGLAPLTLT